MNIRQKKNGVIIIFYFLLKEKVTDLNRSKEDTCNLLPYGGNSYKITLKIIIKVSQTSSLD